MSAPSTNGDGRERSVRVDVFAPVDLAREHDLTAMETWGLVTLTLRADYRSGKWTGRVEDLAEQMRASRNTARRVLQRLRECRLVGVVREFGRGPDRQGVLLVAAYPRTRVAVSKADRETDLAVAQFCAVDGPFSANGSDPNRAAIAQQSRSNRADVRDSGSPTCDDVGREDARRGGDEETASYARTGADLEAHEHFGSEPPDDAVDDDPLVEPCHLCAKPSTGVDRDVAYCDEHMTFADDGRLVDVAPVNDPRRYRT